MPEAMAPVSITRVDELVETRNWPSSRHDCQSGRGLSNEKGRGQKFTHATCAISCNASVEFKS